MIDHFHLIQDANRRLNEARKLEQELRKIRLNWKVFLKGKENLTFKEAKLLEKYFSLFPILQCFYQIKEELRDIYSLKTKDEAREKLKQLRLRMEFMDIIEIKLWAKTLRKYEEYILNFFDKRTSNGYTEGIMLNANLSSEYRLVLETLMFTLEKQCWRFYHLL